MRLHHADRVRHRVSAEATWAWFVGIAPDSVYFDARVPQESFVQYTSPWQEFTCLDAVCTATVCVAASIADERFYAAQSASANEREAIIAVLAWAARRLGGDTVAGHRRLALLEQMLRRTVRDGIRDPQVKACISALSTELDRRGTLFGADLHRFLGRHLVRGTGRRIPLLVPVLRSLGARPAPRAPTDEPSASRQAS